MLILRLTTSKNPVIASVDTNVVKMPCLNRYQKTDFIISFV